MVSSTSGSSGASSSPTMGPAGTVRAAQAWHTLLPSPLPSQKKAQLSPSKHSSPPTFYPRRCARGTGSKFLSWEQRSRAGIQQGGWGTSCPQPARSSPDGAASTHPLPWLCSGPNLPLAMRKYSHAFPSLSPFSPLHRYMEDKNSEKIVREDQM